MAKAPGQEGWHRSRRKRRSGLSSGQAARYCLVTPDTIGNWIGQGHLPAQRTRGGQYRIRPDDLRAFMVAHGMRTDVLDEDLGCAPACWEFWAALDLSAGRAGRDGAAANGPDCVHCPVYRSRASVCHAVRPLLPGGTVRAPSCPDCVFFATVRGIETDEA